MAGSRRLRCSLVGIPKSAGGPDTATGDDIAARELIGEFACEGGAEPVEFVPLPLPLPLFLRDGLRED